MSPDVLSFIQGCVLVFGGAASVVLTGFITQRDPKDIVPQAAAIIAMDVMLALLIVGH
jgi:hypothetical protein